MFRSGNLHIKYRFPLPCVEYREYEIPIITEQIKPPVDKIFDKKEMDILAIDPEFAYFYSDRKIDEFLKSLGFKPVNPFDEKYTEQKIKKFLNRETQEFNNITFRKLFVSNAKDAGIIISYQTPTLCMIEEDDGNIKCAISVYPVERRVDFFSCDEWWIIDLWNNILYHQKYVGIDEVMDRIIRYYDKEIRKRFSDPGYYIS